VLIMAGWPNGDLIWSTDSLNGGDPYFKVSLPTDRIEAEARAMARLIQEIPEKERQHLTLGHLPFHRIEVRQDGRVVALESVHEMAERFEGSTATDRGVFFNPGEDRALVLARASPKYQEFRLTWARLRRRMSGLVPSSFERVQVISDARSNIEPEYNITPQRGRPRIDLGDDPAMVQCWFVENDGEGHHGYAASDGSFGYVPPDGRGLFPSREALRDALVQALRDPHANGKVRNPEIIGWHAPAPRGWRIRELNTAELEELRGALAHNR
jgi:hypothetical protein